MFTEYITAEIKKPDWLDSLEIINSLNNMDYNINYNMQLETIQEEHEIKKHTEKKQIEKSVTNEDS